MRVAFAGTPEFARLALEAIVAAGHEVTLVLTQPDRPAGRGMKLQSSPVKQLATSLHLPLAQPRSLRLQGKHPEDARAAEAALRRAAPEVMVVAAYGLILPPWVLALPAAGCLNIHASLLPRWRGAAPIQRAIEAGDATTGITIMRMGAGLDTGPMLLEEVMPIAADDTAATLHDRLARLGARLIVEALARGPALPAREQPAEGVTYAHKIDKAEAAIDWQQPAAVIERRLRAFDPFPGCTAEIAGQPLKVWRGRVAQGDAGAAAGSVLAAGPGRLVVACGGPPRQALEILEVQVPGGRRMPVREWLQRAGPTPA
ncbi:MAG: methionyl-tRNA formyltransferase [Burkholderiales bacterium]|nr:methionyl-tRNA formyltransferase [Burkholderiales bacterium]